MARATLSWTLATALVAFCTFFLAFFDRHEAPRYRGSEERLPNRLVDSADTSQRDDSRTAADRLQAEVTALHTSVADRLSAVETLLYGGRGGTLKAGAQDQDGHPLGRGSLRAVEERLRLFTHLPKLLKTIGGLVSVRSHQPKPRFKVTWSD